MKKLQLELGGKNPCIVFSDCYLDETVEGAGFTQMWNTGQVCCSGSRLIVEKKIANKFIDKLKTHLKQAYTSNINNPLLETTMLGPLSSKGHFNKVKGYIDLLEKEGGKIILGGGYQGKPGFECNKKFANTQFSNGYWVEPTIVLNLDENTRCVKEEIFGPIVSVHTFETEEEAIKMANNTTYGLSATVWTSDIRKGQRVARQLEAGSIWINCFGVQDHRQAFGGYKKSGVQRENGIHSINFYSEIKSVK